MSTDVEAGCLSDEFYWSETINDDDVINLEDEKVFRFNDLVQGLTEFQLNFGHWDVPLKYQILEGDYRFSPSLWGLNLDVCYDDVCCKQLDERGIFVPHACYAKDYELIFLALEVYQSYFGHARVPVSFIIQTDSIAFPFECRGLHLGLEVSDLCKVRHRLLPEYLKMFNEFGLKKRYCTNKAPLKSSRKWLNHWLIQAAHGNSVDVPLMATTDNEDEESVDDAFEEEKSIQSVDTNELFGIETFDTDSETAKQFKREAEERLFCSLLDDDDDEDFWLEQDAVTSSNYSRSRMGVSKISTASSAFTLDFDNEDADGEQQLAISQSSSGRKRKTLIDSDDDSSDKSNKNSSSELDDEAYCDEQISVQSAESELDALEEDALSDSHSSSSDGVRRRTRFSGKGKHFGFVRRKSSRRNKRMFEEDFIVDTDNDDDDDDVVEKELPLIKQMSRIVTKSIDEESSKESGEVGSFEGLSSEEESVLHAKKRKYRNLQSGKRLKRNSIDFHSPAEVVCETADKFDVDDDQELYWSEALTMPAKASKQFTFHKSRFNKVTPSDSNDSDESAIASRRIQRKRSNDDESEDDGSVIDQYQSNRSSSRRLRNRVATHYDVDSNATWGGFSDEDLADVLDRRNIVTGRRTRKVVDYSEYDVSVFDDRD